VPTPGARTGVRILLVHDDPTVGDACSRALRLDGHEVWAALTLEEGLKLALAHTPQAVLIDVRVPLASGARLARALRDLPALSATPLALVTGDRFPTPESVQALRTLDVHLRQKPIWLEELVDLARELVRQATAAINY
jgi:DNA-binding response OmpR family regulator